MKEDTYETYIYQLAAVIDSDETHDDMEGAIKDLMRMKGTPAVLDRLRDEHAADKERWNKMKEENAKEKNQANVAVNKKD